MENINDKVSTKIKNELSSCYNGDDDTIKLYIETAAYSAAMKMAELKDKSFENLKDTLKFEVRQLTNIIGLSRRLFEQKGLVEYLDDIGKASKKIENTVDNISTDKFFENLQFCKEEDLSKIHEEEKNMLKFLKWLEKRGFIKDDLCYDTEHQVHTFVTQILPQFK